MLKKWLFLKFHYNSIRKRHLKFSYERFTALKMQKPELRTILSVGETNEETDEMTKMLSTEANRNEFIKTSVQFLRQRNFDGLDFHFPGSKTSFPDDKRRFTLLLEVF